MHKQWNNGQRDKDVLSVFSKHELAVMDSKKKQSIFILHAYLGNLNKPLRIQKRSIVPLKLLIPGFHFVLRTPCRRAAWFFGFSVCFSDTAASRSFRTSCSPLRGGL